ncbi:MAG: hypothetical protein Q9217_005895 [Psora testacea]
MVIRHFAYSSRLASLYGRPQPNLPLLYRSRARPPPLPTLLRTLASKSAADEKIEEIQELYATAKDEFEIAAEETEKKTVYAADDRAAAQEELVKLKTVFEGAIKGEGGEEIQKRIGGRMRELERAVEAMEEWAKQE